MFAALILIGISLFYNHQLTECARLEVIEPVVQGNLSDSQTLRFKYFLESNDDPTTILLKCGYYTTSTFQVVVRKTGVAGQLISQLARFEPYVDPSNPTVLGFTIRDIRREDARDYVCTLDYVATGRGIDQTTSPPVRFEVLIRPTWFNDNCLRDFDPVIQEGNDMKITCIVTGFPPPVLQCTLHKFNGDLVDGSNRLGPENANFTSRTFSRVPKDSRRIMCQAYTSSVNTGVLTKVVDMPPQFSYSPFPVRVFELVSLSARSIQLRWLPIPVNETNPPLRHYAIDYYIEDIGLTNLTRKTVPVFAPNNPSRDNIFIYDTLENLAAGRRYIIAILGVNTFPDGSPRDGQSVRLPGSILVSQSATSSSSSNSGMIGGIVGGVIGGIVLIIIIVVLVIYCSRKKETKTHYPTSYVEDAVDYPNQGGLGGYAPLVKGKPQRHASPAGYPDVVAGGDKKQTAVRDSSPSYEMSNKAFV